MAKETGVPRENHRLATLVVIGIDCIGSYKSNYHTITTAIAINVIVIAWSVVLSCIYQHTTLQLRNEIHVLSESGDKQSFQEYHELHVIDGYKTALCML